jgi:hypothetical protein
MGAQVHTVYANARTQQRLPPRAGRPRSMPLPARRLPVVIHLRTNLTTRVLAALCDTSQSTADRIIHHLLPVLTDAFRPAPDNQRSPMPHRWQADPRARPVDHRDPARITAAASTPRSTSALIGDVRSSPASAGQVTATTSSLPATPWHSCSIVVSPWATADTATSHHHRSTARPLRPDHPRQPLPRHTAASAPTSSTSSPASKTGKSCVNATAAANPSTTASKPSQDPGTSRLTINYGSTVSVAIGPPRRNGGA